MDLTLSALENLLSPAFLFFILGVVAAILKSDIAIPEGVSRFISIYLLIAIGFSGGVSLVTSTAFSWQLLGFICIALFIAFLLPFLGYSFLRLTTTLDRLTASAVAAHYGSISVVTFMIGVTFLETRSVSYAGYIVAIMALMETPAILSGLYLASKSNSTSVWHAAKKEIFTSSPVIILLGAFLIGLLTGNQGMEKLTGFVKVPFHGMLCLFLLEMGLHVGNKVYLLRELSCRVALFGIYMPLVGATIALMIGYFLPLDLGTLFLFATLSASASYIAVPAAMRLALPNAQSAIYVPLALGITFPFNVTLGLPLYFSLAAKLTQL